MSKSAGDFKPTFEAILLSKETSFLEPFKHRMLLNDIENDILGYMGLLMSTYAAVTCKIYVNSFPLWIRFSLP